MRGRRRRRPTSSGSLLLGDEPVTAAGHDQRLGHALLDAASWSGGPLLAIGYVAAVDARGRRVRAVPLDADRLAAGRRPRRARAAGRLVRCCSPSTPPQALHPYLPTRYWLAFVDLFRDPILWRDLVRGVVLQAVYVVVLLGAAWANFTTKDVTD